MKIPIARYGRFESGLIAVLAILAIILCWLFVGGWPWPELAILVVAAGLIAFFRDPDRKVPHDWGVLVAPADGKVTDIKELDEQEYLKGPATRVGIFLSVFDVHINRAPCAGEVGYTQRHPGKCLNALRSEAASEQNEAYCMGLNCLDHPAGKVMVKQITGAIARRIVCQAKVGDKLLAGERYGMIKFGSRTELFLPVDESAKVLVKPGDVVRAGSTILVRYAQRGTEAE